MDAQTERETPFDRLASELHEAQSDVAVRVGLISELGELEDGRAIELIAPFLDSDDVSTRWEVCVALGRLDGVAAAPHLRRALQDEERLVRTTAAGWLGDQRNVEAVPEIAPMLHSGSWLERVQAAWALGEIGDAAAEDELRAARKRTLRPWRKLTLQRRLRRSRAVRRELGPPLAKPPPDPEYAELLVERAAQRSTYLGERPDRNQAVVDAVQETVAEVAQAGLATVEVRDVPVPMQAATEIDVHPRDAGCCPITVRVDVWMYVVRLGNDGAALETSGFGARGRRRSLRTIRNAVRLAIEGGYEEYVRRDPASGHVKVAGELSRRGLTKDFAYRNTLKMPRKGLERRGWEHVRYRPYDPGWSDRPGSHEVVVRSVTEAVRDVVGKGMATIETRDAAAVRDEPVTEIEVRPSDARHCPIKVHVWGKSSITLFLGRHDASGEVSALSTRRRLRTLGKRIDAAIAGEYKEYVWRDPQSGKVKVRGELRAGNSPGERFGDANTLRWESLSERGWEYSEYIPYDASDRRI